MALALDFAQLGGALVGNDELLYRSIRADDVTSVSGRTVLSSTAFNDAAMKPSVDRASIRSAEEAKRSPSDGVCGLMASEVRSINSVLHQDSKLPYRVDVMERPEVDNAAHAQVEVDPLFESPSRFKKLKECLCRIAEHQVLIAPG